MRIPLTRYGMPQIIVWPPVITAAAVLVYWAWPASRPWSLIAAVPLLLWILAFFRDPHRIVPDEPGILVAPADGTITDIGRFESAEFLDGPVIRIGIFLSIFDVHINRAPCAGRVEYLKFHPGKCLNALRWQAASEQNQAQSIGLDCPDHPARRVLVKQITGAIARRIVCKCSSGEMLDAGQQFGMIKFGSRTELFFPADVPAEMMVQKGQTVRAGHTILVRFTSETSSPLEPEHSVTV